MASDSKLITLYVKRMTGELVEILVDSSLGLRGLRLSLHLRDREAFPLDNIRFFNDDEKEFNPNMLSDGDMINVFIDVTHFRNFTSAHVMCSEEGDNISIISLQRSPILEKPQRFHNPIRTVLYYSPKKGFTTQVDLLKIDETWILRTSLVEKWFATAEEALFDTFSSSHAQSLSILFANRLVSCCQCGHYFVESGQNFHDFHDCHHE